MKKLIALLLIGLAIAAYNAFGQTMLNTNKYFRFFPIKINKKIYDNDYVWTSDEDSYGRFALLSGENDLIDSYLEFALLSYYSQPVLNIRPPEADVILPKNNPKLADQKLGAAVFQEIQILRFLGDTAAVNRHEAVLKFITDRKNVTRAEIEAFYRDNIRGLIAAVVDDEFKGITIPSQTVTFIKQSLTNFFTTPNQANFDIIKNIYDTVTDDIGIQLDSYQYLYDGSQQSIKAYESMNMPKAAEAARSEAMEYQNLLNTRRRKLNAPNDAPINWGRFMSAYGRILNMLNTELVRIKFPGSYPR